MTNDPTLPPLSPAPTLESVDRRLNRRARYWAVMRLFLSIYSDFALEKVQRRLFGHGFVERRHAAMLRRQAARFRETAIRMGGLLIKLGQFLSSRVDLLPEEYTDELAKLQDEVPAEDYNEVAAMVVAEFGHPVEEVFASFSHKALAAASLGQVHEARLHDGTRVAVKVQRPRIDEIVDIDLASLRRVVNLLDSLTDWGRRFDLDLVFREFASTVRKELDYVQEGRNAQQFRKNFKGFKEVYIPKIYWAQTTRRVLTLEYIEGIKVSDTTALDANGIDHTEVVRLLVESYLEQMIHHGLIHADPHPGNVFIVGRDGFTTVGGRHLKPGNIIFVDFGMVGQITETDKHNFRRLFLGVAARDVREIIAAAQGLGFVRPTADMNALRRSLAWIIERFSTNSLQEIYGLDIEDILFELKDLMESHAFQIPANFIFLGRAIATLSGLASGLDPDVNLIKLFEPYARELMEEDQAQAGGALKQRLTALGLNLLALPGLAEKVLRQAQEGDLRVRIEAPEMTEAYHRQEAATSRLSVMVLAGSLLIAGSVFWTGGHHLVGNWAFVGATGAALAALRHGDRSVEWIRRHASRMRKKD
ncbi:MAG TPA: AarF/ABC1/UbiB kinase family protein [Bacillota bacterium]